MDSVLSEALYYAWKLGVAAYAGAIFLFMALDTTPQGHEIFVDIYTFFFWAAVPILIAVSFVVLLLHPIYVLALCDLYSDYLSRKEQEVAQP